jgi:hypothetical protein
MLKKINDHRQRVFIDIYARALPIHNAHLNALCRREFAEGMIAN